MVRGPAVARDNINEGGESILGSGSRVRGRVTGDGDLRVEGHVEGDVSISGELSIEEGATVAGTVGASAVVIAGSLVGDIDVRGPTTPVTIRATAKVEGNLGNAEVSLEEGASFKGRIDAEFDLPAELAPTPQAPARGR